MANNNISVNKQTVVELLRSGKDRRFVIPEYQRPYAWGDDEVITLFDDLWEFSIDRLRPNGSKTYFLGCVVSFENEQSEQEIIDGQQRLTSLFLLLRAIYANLEKDESQCDEVVNFLNKIRPAIWLEDEMSGKVDFAKILLHSEVATENGNEILRSILETGTTQPEAKDAYSRNYNKFVELLEDKARNNYIHMFQFINALLNYTILLPITADNQDTALTIFSTLNNRGLALSDADIFKSLIYKQLDALEKSAFAKRWRDFEEEASQYGENIQSLFAHHMFYLRACEKDEKSTTPGVRKYFMEKGKNRLNPEVMDHLASTLNLWKVVRRREPLPTEPWSDNIEILKTLDILQEYNNEYWKYPALIYYRQHKDHPEFETLYLKFLRKLCVLVLTRYLESPTINAIKGDIMKLNSAIIGNPHPDFFAGFRNPLPDEGPHPNITVPTRTIVRMLLKLLAYTESSQTTLLPDKWDIEHIFPQKWDTSFCTLPQEETYEKLEHLGNKIPLEKRLNIRASNNYFDRKKEQYAESQIAIAQQFATLPKANWMPTDIDARDIEISNTVIALLNKWTTDYDATSTHPEAPVPTPEQAEQIRQLRALGLIP